MDLIKKVQARLLSQRDARAIRKNGYPVVRLGAGPDRPRGLLMYLSPPLTWKVGDPRLDWHENMRQSRQIAELMVEAGYQVDVVDMNDDAFTTEIEYNLFIGHGSNAAKLARRLGTKTRKICLATGQYGPYANKNVEQRYRALEQRRNVFLKRKMPSGVGNEHYNVFDEIACFGNKHTADTFAVLDMPVYPFPNYPNPKIKPLARNLKESRQGFVYIAANLHVLKGLDLLIEAFAKKPDLNLYVCGVLKNELVPIYGPQLALPNIHDCGYVRMGGRVWNQIASKAAWYISPSSSDSCQGAALNAMAAGLIPVLSNAIGIDAHGAGRILSDCKIQTIETEIQTLASLPADRIGAMSQLAQRVVEKYYNEGAFKSRWREIIVSN